MVRPSFFFWSDTADIAAQPKAPQGGEKPVLAEKRRGALVMLLLGACLLTGGCWDRREIQDRHFVLAVAIDKAETSSKKV